MTIVTIAACAVFFFAGAFFGAGWMFFLQQARSSDLQDKLDDMERRLGLAHDHG